jgi:hypothetical protein
MAAAAANAKKELKVDEDDEDDEDVEDMVVVEKGGGVVEMVRNIVGFRGGGIGVVVGLFRGCYKRWGGRPFFGERGGGVPIFQPGRKKTMGIRAILSTYGGSEGSKIAQTSLLGPFLAVKVVFTAFRHFLFFFAIFVIFLRFWLIFVLSRRFSRKGRGRYLNSDLRPTMVRKRENVRRLRFFNFPIFFICAWHLLGTLCRV